MRRGGLLIGGMIAGVMTVAASVAAPPAAGPKARYWMDVATTSGFMAGGGNPMAMMRGGGGEAAHQLTLRLGSTEAAAGAPSADHFMPAGMRLGPSVPLATPAGSPRMDRPPGQMPEHFQRPKGRLLLFWGCGAHAGPGQPAVIDFSALAAGQMPAGLFAANVPVEPGPLASTSRTFGEWPNATARRSDVPAGASLIGDHRVAGNYSPEIRFAIAQDFMPAIRASSTPAADGSIALGWQPVQAATGYYAWVMGARGMSEEGGADMVWWTSAGAREFGAGLTDWLPPATVTRLIGEKIVLPPSQTSCTIPAEVKAAAGPMMMAQLYAYGPELDFAYPPRPARAPASWAPDWTARVRYKASAGLMLGMPGMDAMMRGDMPGEAAPSADQPAARKACKPSLGGLLKGKICR